MFSIILLSLYIKLCFCQLPEIVLELPRGTFEIEAKLTLNEKNVYGYKRRIERFIKETVTIGSDNNSIGIMETSDIYQVEKRKFFYRYHNGTNGMERKSLVVNKNRCNDPSVGGYSGTGSKSLDCILALGVFYFYQDLLIRKFHVIDGSYQTKELNLNGLDVSKDCQPIGLIGNIKLIFAPKYDHDGKTLRVEQLTTVTLNSYANDFDAKFNVISVKKLLSTFIPLPMDLHLGCPHFLQKEEPKFPGQNVINRYNVKVSETIDIKSNNGLESVEKHGFIIDTLNEISKITKFQQGSLTEFINDYHFGIKYLLRDSADDLKCQVEPISLDKDSMTMAKGSLSFNDIAWMDNPFAYAGRYQLAWNPNNGNQTKNVTFDVWQNTFFTNLDPKHAGRNTKIYPLRGKIITTLYMINQSIFDQHSDSISDPSEALFGFIPIRVERNVYMTRDSIKPKVSHERQFYDFNTRLINSQYPSSIFGLKYYKDQCYNGAMNKSVTIKLKITNAVEYKTAQVNFNGGNDPNEIARSLLRITINYLHVSSLRIKEIVIKLIETDFEATIQVFEAVDLIGLHTKTSQRFDLKTLKTFQSINVQNDHDCFSKQGADINISYVISCPSSNNCPTLDKFLCIGIKSGQSLPNENKDGISCSIFDNTYNTLSTVAEEASLKDIIKYSSRLRGLTFQVNHTFYRIADSWTTDHPNLTDIELPSQHYLEPTQSTNNEQDKKRSSIKATNVTNGVSANGQSTQKSKHFSGLSVLIILMLISIILSLVAFQVHKNYFPFKLPTSDSSIISLETL